MLAFVFVTEEGVVVTNVLAFVTVPSDLIVILGIITLWAFELKMKGCDLSRFCEEGVSCRQPS